MSLVHLLPSSDHIIALGQDGQVVEQGSFAKLLSSGKYIQSLDITDPHADDTDSDEDTPKQDVVEEIKNLVQVSEEAEQEIEAEQPVSSDRSTFKYYFSAMSPLSLAIGGGYIFVQAFSAAFRGK